MAREQEVSTINGLYQLSGHEEMGRHHHGGGFLKHLHLPHIKISIIKVLAAPARAGFLLATEMNIGGLAKHFAKVYQHDPNAVKSFWRKFGGDEGKFLKAISKGAHQRINAPEEITNPTTGQKIVVFRLPAATNYKLVAWGGRRRSFNSCFWQPAPPMRPQQVGFLPAVGIAAAAPIIVAAISFLTHIKKKDGTPVLNPDSVVGDLAGVSQLATDATQQLKGDASYTKETMDVVKGMDGEIPGGGLVKDHQFKGEGGFFDKDILGIPMPVVLLGAAGTMYLVMRK